MRLATDAVNWCHTIAWHVCPQISNLSIASTWSTSSKHRHPPGTVANAGVAKTIIAIVRGAAKPQVRWSHGGDTTDKWGDGVRDVEPDPHPV